MYICVKLFLKVDEALGKILLNYESDFKKEVARICELFKKQGYAYEYAYRYFSKAISYNSKHLVLATAREMYLKQEKGEKFMYGFSSYWSNSSYEVTRDYLKLELGPDMHRDRLLVPIYSNSYQLDQISNGRSMNLKLIHRKHKWIAVLYVEMQPKLCTSTRCMGIDIGVKVPAVTAIEPNIIKFFGNGREIRYVQRKYRSHIVAMQKNKQYKKLRRYEHKLSHILNDYDHKISKEIIDYAIKNEIGIIKLENLNAINRKFANSKNHTIYLWSYRRLQEYISYKANLNGIRVKYINPYLTSQTCPHCGKINHVKDRSYNCVCGYHNHRDAVAAINIMNTL